MKAQLIALLEGILRVSSRQLYKWRQSINTEVSQEVGHTDRTFSVVITTHSRRFFSGALPLLKTLRSSEAFRNVAIYVVVNADTFGSYDFSLRSRFLEQACALGNVFPVSLGEPAGMSELWNTGIRAAGTKHVLVLSDDLTILDEGLPELRRKVSQSLEHTPLCVINKSWGHFAISQDAIDKVGWFEDRLLGFGHEDGDYTHRFRKVYETEPLDIQVFGVNNVSSKVGFEEIVKGTGKYSLFNDVMISQKYGPTSQQGFGVFGKLNESTQEHPGNASWEFKQKFKHLLNEADPEQISIELERYFNQTGK